MVMRNIWNRHKCIKHINSFIFRILVLWYRVPYMLRVLSPTFMVQGPSFHSMRWVLAPNFRVPGLGSRVSLWDGSRDSGPTFMVPDLGSRVPGPTTSPRSRVPLSGYTGLFIQVNLIKSDYFAKFYHDWFFMM